jgi:hypothetical protein
MVKQGISVGNLEPYQSHGHFIAHDWKAVITYQHGFWS